MVNYAVLSILALFAAILALARALRDHFFYRRRLRELQKRVLDAERLLKLRGRLAHEVAHEIKNPLTAILCSAETLDLLIGPQIGGQHRQSLLFIKEYGESLLRLVSDFLDVSRAEAGQISCAPERVPIEPVVRSVLGLLQSSALRRRVSLDFCPCSGGLCAFMDPKHLRQVLFNLAHNAVKFSPEGGAVRITAGRDPCRPSRIKIAVHDNGAGISKERLARIFDPYFSYEEHGGHPHAGVGLGLAVCKSLVELAGGEISASSEAGAGTEFEIKLPEYRASPRLCAEALHGEPCFRKEEQPQPLAGQSFLIVDENTGTRESIARLIEAWGGVVDRAALAAEAIEAVSRNVYDAVMIDGGIDGGYGCELARMIREEFKTGRTCLIVAAAASSHERLLLESGVDFCVFKPLNGKVLLSSLLR